MEQAQAHRPQLIYVVDDLDAPWKVACDLDGEQYLLVRYGTPLTVPLVNVINDLAEQRTMLSRLRKQMEHWNGEHVSPVPQQVPRLCRVDEPAGRNPSAMDQP